MPSATSSENLQFYTIIMKPKRHDVYEITRGFIAEQCVQSFPSNHRQQNRQRQRLRKKRSNGDGMRKNPQLTVHKEHKASARTAQPLPGLKRCAESAETLSPSSGPEGMDPVSRFPVIKTYDLPHCHKTNNNRYNHHQPLHNLGPNVRGKLSHEG